MIIGLPGEDFSDYTDTLKYALSAGTRGVKFQVLNILTGTKLEEMYANGFLKAFDQDEYVDTVVKLVSMLPSDVVVHRLTGDGNRAHLIAPRWALDKRKTLNMIAKRISR